MAKFHLTTYGCQMNKNDSERIAGLLEGLGFTSTEEESRADLIVLNTCSVRQSAEERVYGSMEKYERFKETNPKLIVAVTGCMPGRDKERTFLKKMPVVDLYFPTPEMVKLPKWIAELRPDLVNSGDLQTDYLKIIPARRPSTQAFVTIQTGCNKFCTYCVVPFARGLEKNRPVADILQEVRQLVAHGVIEMTFLGQTVNSYKSSDPENFSKENPYQDHFAALLWEVNRLEGLERIHWTAPHPNSMTDEVIDALALPNQVNYLHLPVQSGSNEVLKRMNRKYTREKFIDVIQHVKVKRPEIAIGTDIIVGFPGETAEQFNETVSLYRACEFDISYTAQYSPRSGTLGVRLFQDDVSAEEKKRRWNMLQGIMEELTLQKNQSYVGHVVSVLVEQIEQGIARGNSREMKLVKFSSRETTQIGSIVNVKIDKAMEWQLLGTLL